MASSNFIFDAAVGTTEAPLAQSTPIPLASPTAVGRMNRTAFHAFFEQYKLTVGPDNFTDHPHAECMVRQILENLTLEWDLGEGGKYL